MLKTKNLIKCLVLPVVVLVVFSPAVWSYAPEMRRAMISGPWELVVKSDMQSEGILIPVTVADEDKSADINTTTPLIFSTKTIQIEKYIPDLQWKTFSDKYNGRGGTAEIRITGPGLEQVRWLSTDDDARATVTSTIGGVTVKSLYDTPDVENIVEQLVKPEVIGLVSVLLDAKSGPLQFVAKQGFEVELPDSQYKLKVLNYYPHYAVDKISRKASNQSDQPVNPAIEVQIRHGKKEFRQWLWSRSSSPHMKYKLPFKVEFSEFNFAAKKGYYELLVASDDKQWLISNDGDKRVIQVADTSRKYPFADDKYGFEITQVNGNSILKNEWFNGSQSLMNPALVVNVFDGDQSDRVVLNLGLAVEAKERVGSVVLLFRKKMGMMPGVEMPADTKMK